MRRGRVLLVGSLAVAGVALALWAWIAPGDPSPNPVRVVVGPDDGEGLISPVTLAGASPDSVEVTVARARPIPMKIERIPVAGGPAGPDPLFGVDAEALAAEEKELRAALDAWLAGPGRALAIETTWTEQQFRSGVLDGILGRRPEQCRVVLHARLRPRTAGGASAPPPAGGSTEPPPPERK